jgi:hypothetical protein
VGEIRHESRHAVVPVMSVNEGCSGATSHLECRLVSSSLTGYYVCSWARQCMRKRHQFTVPAPPILHHTRRDSTETPFFLSFEPATAFVEPRTRNKRYITTALEWTATLRVAMMQTTSGLTNLSPSTVSLGVEPYTRVVRLVGRVLRSCRACVDVTSEIQSSCRLERMLC